MAGFSSTAEEESTCMSDGCWSAGFDMAVAAEADLRRSAQMRSRRRGAEAECVRPSSRKGLNPIDWYNPGNIKYQITVSEPNSLR